MKKKEIRVHGPEDNHRLPRPGVRLNKKKGSITFNPSAFDRPVLTLLFDSNQWYLPFRYISEGAVRTEMSQYFIKKANAI
ncbi:hypothetical protein, partial [Clostridioides difficile]|uniref:hypothetical protein n=1 Tax=Clostridioides difficile TaxID=1496 RepID=UPI002113C53E|nr:hypothetical protein [Clostridioides difficile]